MAACPCWRGNGWATSRAPRRGRAGAAERAGHPRRDYFFAAASLAAAALRFSWRFHFWRMMFCTRRCLLLLRAMSGVSWVKVGQTRGAYVPEVPPEEEPPLSSGAGRVGWGKLLSDRRTLETGAPSPSGGRDGAAGALVGWARLRAGAKRGRLAVTKGRTSSRGSAGTKLPLTPVMDVAMHMALRMASSVASITAS